MEEKCADKRKIVKNTILLYGSKNKKWASFQQQCDGLRVPLLPELEELVVDEVLVVFLSDKVFIE